jgi:uncharacterized membrane protein (TIGR02234 family)
MNAHPRRAAMNPRREMATVLGVILVGTVVVLLAAARTWLTAAWVEPGIPGVQVALTGSEVAPLVRAAGFVALAGVVALLATRRRGRLVVGALVCLAGVAVVAGCVLFAATYRSSADEALADAAGETTATVRASELAAGGWSAGAATGGAMVAAGGVLTMLRSARWPEMGTRYDAPAAAATARRDQDDPWGALDRGEDPTTR